MLATQYMSATAFNDVSDFEIDKLNIPKDNSRPLMTMNISKKQLTIFAYSFLITSIILSLLISPIYIFYALSGIFLSVFYSIKPFAISHRGILASLWLPLSYVVLSFVGGASINGGLNSFSIKILIALYISFIGRIILKDFRDVVGDKKFGKKTFLVRHGAKLTCLVASSAWLIGDLVLSISLWSKFKLQVVLIQCVFVLIIYSLYLLSKEPRLKNQLIIIKFIGATSNITLIGLLTVLCLSAFNHPKYVNTSIYLSMVFFFGMIAGRIALEKMEVFIASKSTR